MAARTVELSFDQFTVGNIRKPRVVKGVTRYSDGREAPVTVVLMPADRKAPAKVLESKKATRAVRPQAAPKAAKPKVLSRGVAKAIKATKAGKKYAGLTPAQMIEAGLKGYVLPGGHVAARINEAAVRGHVDGI